MWCRLRTNMVNFHCFVLHCTNKNIVLDTENFFLSTVYYCYSNLQTLLVPARCTMHVQVDNSHLWRCWWCLVGWSLQEPAELSFSLQPSRLLLGDATSAQWRSPELPQLQAHMQGWYTHVYSTKLLLPEKYNKFFAISMVTSDAVRITNHICLVQHLIIYNFIVWTRQLHVRTIKL